ncbi:hypothetical protein [Rhizobium etli]|uniref:hypothetical protein n=1 Tax=Rhizobium etli TaxID=29449 RepID=UPI0018AD38B3|nr:hypothetical protein [Rhizobium etli]
MIFVFINASRLRHSVRVHSFQQKIRQRFHQPFDVLDRRNLKILALQLQNELVAILMSPASHHPSPSSSKDGILLLLRESRRTMPAPLPIR